MTWDVTEITVEAHSAGYSAPDTTLTVGCQSVTEIPPDQSNSKYPRLIVRGVDSAALQKLNKLRLSLTRLLFRDQETGGQLAFPAKLLDAYEGTATFSVHH